MHDDEKLQLEALKTEQSRIDKEMQRLALAAQTANASDANSG